MSEALFVLTVIFVAYVVYKTVDGQKATPTPLKTKVEAPKVVIEQKKPETVIKNNKPATIKIAAIKKSTPIAVTQNNVKKGLRDPNTGEVVTSYSNYRFIKRWIKDALVTEGLLEKIYKNNELDTAIEVTIKEALVKLEAIDKYKPEALGR